MTARKKSITSAKNPFKANNNIVTLMALILFIDGFIRLYFSSSMYYIFPGIYLNTDLYFHLRWFGIGILDLIFAWGILKYRIWALYGFLALTMVRFYTIIVYPPKGLLLPISSNWITYSLKIVAAILLVYLLNYRKKLKFS